MGGTEGKTGWSVLPSRKQTVQLQYRQPGKRGEKHPSTTVSLPYRWSETSITEVLARCTQIQQVMSRQGLTLKEAASVASGKSSHKVEDWGKAIDAFRDWKQNNGRVVIGSRTWDTKYQPFLQIVVGLVKGPNAVTNGTALLEALAKNWKPGTAMRTHAVRNVSAFLRYAVERQEFRRSWLPPDSLRDVIGLKREGKDKRIGYGLTDEQFVALVEGIDNPAHRFAVQLMGVYGLRPEDLRYLTVIDGALWSLYRKTGGSGLTKPRQLFALYPEGVEGWDLLGRFQQGEKLPSLGTPGNAGDRVGCFLKRKPAWQKLREEVEALGKELTPYSLRHRYVRRGQLKGIPPKVLADALGHSLASHLSSYSAWSDGDAMASFFD